MDNTTTLDTPHAPRSHTPTPTQAWLLAARPKTLPAATSSPSSSARPSPSPTTPSTSARPSLASPSPSCKSARTSPTTSSTSAAVPTLHERLGPTRVTQSGILPRAVALGTVVVMTLAAVAEMYLVYRAGWVLLLLGIAAILSAPAYTGGPFLLGYNGLGEVFVLIFFGFVAVTGTYYTQARDISGLSSPPPSRSARSSSTSSSSTTSATSTPTAARASAPSPSASARSAPSSNTSSSSPSPTSPPPHPLGHRLAQLLGGSSPGPPSSPGSSSSKSAPAPAAPSTPPSPGPPGSLELLFGLLLAASRLSSCGDPPAEAEGRASPAASVPAGQDSPKFTTDRLATRLASPASAAVPTTPSTAAIGTTAPAASSSSYRRPPPR
ncbi:MAG: hypothetical protein U0232_12655 [Thermomicrobiales bacterium]